MLCVLTAGKTLMLAGSLFTVSWTHSVERQRWEEDWRVGPAGIAVVEARVRGSGAGMEPPDGAVLEDGWWTFRPDLPPQPEILLAASGATGEGWRICGRECREFGADAEGPIRVRPCPRGR